MRGTGAEQPVVAKKSRHGDGAKGLCRSALPDGQPAMGGAITSGKAGLLRLIDRSRMSREVHVLGGRGGEIPPRYSTLVMPLFLIDWSSPILPIILNH